MPGSHDTEPAGPAEILLVEDEPSDADLCQRALARKHLASRITWVKDGADALDFLSARGQWAGRDAADLPRLVLLDLKLPRVNGFEVLRQIRADLRLTGLPVVVLTSSAQEGDIIESYQLGANSYITKPVDFASFQHTIEETGLYWMTLNQVPQTSR